MSGKDIRDTYVPIVYFDGPHLNTSRKSARKRLPLQE
ncbi:hypothetical protein FHW36_101646 [Chitinophaga polysaccharea]|uniref:Uncharacterized protein n=1 Tax=Chitinophaga polysaccharea TaxID=1293035 RepID=A0A561Q2Y3_9BACT|nr:hypothetical protein FHW36_101646 [Chitinophaga polysaccharea]